jgi:hypothetical protein
VVKLSDRLEAAVRLEIVVPVVVCIWAAVLLFAISLCRAAKRGDDAMRALLASSQAAGGDDETRRSSSPSPVPSPSAAPTHSGAPSPSGALERPLRTLYLEQAARLLDVSPETLLTWEQRFGFPSSTPAEPRYSQSEVLALRDSLDDGASIASAVAMARERIKRRRAPVPGGLFDHHRDGGLAS